MIFIFVLSVLSSVITAHAQLNYSALTIPDSLKKNADAVTREEYIKFTIKDINSARFEVHEVITILNESASSYLDFHEFSYEFRSLDDAEIKVYDALGIKKNTYTNDFKQTKTQKERQKSIIIFCFFHTFIAIIIQMIDV